MRAAYCHIVFNRVESINGGTINYSIHSGCIQFISFNLVEIFISIQALRLNFNDNPSPVFVLEYTTSLLRLIVSLPLSPDEI